MPRGAGLGLLDQCLVWEEMAAGCAGITSGILITCLAAGPLLVAGTLSFMSLGLLAGALAKTQEGAVNLANFVVLPMAVLSGSFFPLGKAPSWLSSSPTCCRCATSTTRCST